jgi:hypothetical protein
MRRDLGHTGFTSLRFPGPGGGPWLAVGRVIAQISKLVTREHVVHGTGSGREGDVSAGQQPTKCKGGLVAGLSVERVRKGGSLIELAEGRRGWRCGSWSVGIRA